MRVRLPFRPRAVDFDGCAAPTSTLYFAPDGAVRACCVNHAYVYGRIGEQSIREIWDGARVQALRDAVAAGDYSLGCQECGSRFDAGGRAWSNAPQFDVFAGRPSGRHPLRMEFILSITCNLQCEMCSGEWSSAIRTQREGRPPLRSPYGDDFFEELREFLPHLEVASFLGGEPFLAREQRRVMDLMLEIGFDQPVSVVTNGTQWNDRVARYLRELPISVTVSVDGVTAETNEMLRAGTRHDEVMENVDAMHDVVRSRGGDLAYQFCLMHQNWHEFGRFLVAAEAKGRPVFVMTVSTAGFSLWDLPIDELRPIVEALDAESGRVRRHLRRNRAVWDRELSRLHAHLERLVEGDTPVWVSVSQSDRKDDLAR